MVCSCCFYCLLFVCFFSLTFTESESVHLDSQFLASEREHLEKNNHHFVCFIYERKTLAYTSCIVSVQVFCEGCDNTCISKSDVNTF